MITDHEVGELVGRYFSQVREMYGDAIYLDEDLLPQILSGFSSLEDFRGSICNCRECHLWEARTNFVFGIGDSEADLVFVGEAPGREEDLRGEPFVGRAGQLLDRILAAIELTRDDVYICNVLKCRPLENRTPTVDETEKCLPYLETQLSLIDPRLIVALGATAAYALLSVKTPLGKLRGRLWKWREIDVVVTYHPAALLRNPRLKRASWEDFKWIRQVMQQG